MKQNMNKKIAVMGIAGLTGFSLISSALGSNVSILNAKTIETVVSNERQDKVKPVSGPAIGDKDRDKDKVKPASGPAIGDKDRDKDKVKPASGSAIGDKDRDKDRVKPTSGPAVGAKDKGITKSPKKNNNTKKVKIKKTKKTAKNKIKITLSGTNTWSNTQVTVKTSAGKNVKAKITKKTSTYCVIQTNKKLEKNTYIIKVKGVKVKGSSKYETITAKIKVK